MGVVHQIGLVARPSENDRHGRRRKHIAAAAGLQLRRSSWGRAGVPGRAERHVGRSTPESTAGSSP